MTSSAEGMTAIAVPCSCCEIYCFNIVIVLFPVSDLLSDQCTVARAVEMQDQAHVVHCRYVIILDL